MVCVALSPDQFWWKHGEPTNSSSVLLQIGVLLSIVEDDMSGSPCANSSREMCFATHKQRLYRGSEGSNDECAGPEYSWTIPLHSRTTTSESQANPNQPHKGSNVCTFVAWALPQTAIIIKYQSWLVVWNPVKSIRVIQPSIPNIVKITNVKNHQPKIISAAVSPCLSPAAYQVTHPGWINPWLLILGIPKSQLVSHLKWYPLN